MPRRSGPGSSRGGGRLAAGCERAGVPCRLRAFKLSWHAFQLYAGLVPEATASVNELATFMREHAGPGLGTGSPSDAGDGV